MEMILYNLTNYTFKLFSIKEMHKFIKPVSGYEKKLDNLPIYCEVFDNLVKTA